jgi:hypothetical protein
MFGDVNIKIDPLNLLREAVEHQVGEMISKGVVGIDKLPGLTKLIASSDEENIKLAAKLLHSYVEKFVKSKVLELQQKEISK